MAKRKTTMQKLKCPYYAKSNETSSKKYTCTNKSIKGNCIYLNHEKCQICKECYNNIKVKKIKAEYLPNQYPKW